MSRPEVLDFLIYRWRYGLGYIAVSLSFIALIIMAGFFAPTGLTANEQVSVVSSDTLSLKHFTPDMIVNLPYHLLQKTSLHVLGMSEISIKLPSLILALVTAFGLLLLLRVWFKQNVAVLGSLVALTTGPFLFFAQDGTPSILYIFFPTWILLAASMITQKVRRRLLWLIVLFGMVALSFYVPMSIYILLTLFTAALIHPHLRSTLKTLPRLQLSVAVIVALIIVAPVGYALAMKHDLALQLLGFSHPTLDIVHNLSLLGQRYFDFVHTHENGIIQPIYELGAMLLIGLGLYRIVTTKYTARSYILVAWLILLAPLLIYNPELTSITFVPALLLIAFGLDLLIRYWYRLFPRNPYARAAGLVSLVILVGSLTLSGTDRFYFGYHYGNDVSRTFSHDLSLLKDWHADHQNGTVAIVSPPTNVGFYIALSHYNPGWHISRVTATPPTTMTTDYTIYAQPTTPTAQPTTGLDEILTDSLSGSADRFYVYKKLAD